MEGQDCMNEAAACGSVRTGMADGGLPEMGDGIARKAETRGRRRLGEEELRSRMEKARRKAERTGDPKDIAKVRSRESYLKRREEILCRVRDIREGRAKSQERMPPEEARRRSLERSKEYYRAHREALLAMRREAYARRKEEKNLPEKKRHIEKAGAGLQSALQAGK